MLPKKKIHITSFAAYTHTRRLQQHRMFVKRQPSAYGYQFSELSHKHDKMDEPVMKNALFWVLLVILSVVDADVDDKDCDCA